MYRINEFSRSDALMLPEIWLGSDPATGGATNGLIERMGSRMSSVKLNDDNDEDDDDNDDVDKNDDDSDVVSVLVEVEVDDALTNAAMADGDKD